MGLGYVGLPLALAFGRAVPTLGFDISQAKIDAYRAGRDPAGEVESSAFAAAKQLQFSADAKDLATATVIVVAVPTPIDHARRPDLTLLCRASALVGRHMGKGTVVVYESTVYPGTTEEVCVPVLEKESGLRRGVDFKVGYSPERINPGDKEHTLEKIQKVVSGEDAETCEQLAALYSRVVTAGVYRAPSIRVAEASKVIENTQRDLNIALVNELAKIFDIMGIDTTEVLDAAATKWNFSRYTPGLVGGHCVGVDPYYLTHKAQMLGYHPEVILAGRRINDSMGQYVASQTVKRLARAGRIVKGARILVMGLTFKENCADLRNSRVADIVSELREYGAQPMVWDPVADVEEARAEYGVELVDLDQLQQLDAVVAAVPHRAVLEVDLTQLAQLADGSIPFMDVKAAFDRDTVRRAGFDLWRL